MIHWELCKKLKFDHTTKQYMQKPESVLENEMQKIFWDFEMQTDHLISVRRSDLVISKKEKKKKEKKKKRKKRTCRIVDFSIQGEHRVKIKENEKIDNYLGLARGLRKMWNGNDNRY